MNSFRDILYRGTMQLLYRIQCKQQMNRQRASKALLFFRNHADECFISRPFGNKQFHTGLRRI